MDENVCCLHKTTFKLVTQKGTKNPSSPSLNPSIQVYTQPQPRNIKNSLTRINPLPGHKNQDTELGHHHKQTHPKMSPSPSIHFSTDFCISCGTITLDPSAHKLLLVFSRPTREFLLPKGRKNIAETLEAAAVRETFEETGVRCTLLPHGFPNLVPRDPAQEQDGTTPPRSTEPIAVQQRMSMGAWKLIFWFVGQADSKVPPVQGTQEVYEEFDPVWVDVDKAAGMMAREHDAEIVRMVVGKVLETVV